MLQSTARHSDTIGRLPGFETMKTPKRLLEENRALRAENAALKAQLAELLVRAIR